MAITSAGYPKINGNTGQVDAAQWAKQFEVMGADYGVVGPNSWVVTPVTTAGVARTVSISPGPGYGRGVYDVLSDAPVQVQAPALGTGTTVRWDTVVAHRDSTVPGTTFTILPGNGTQNIAASRATSPGNVDDQAIALVKLESNTGFPTQIIDLRQWNSKLTYVYDLRAVVDPELGQEVVDSAGTRWRYIMQGGSMTRVRVGQQVRFQRSGTDINGIATPAAQAPLGTFMLTGLWHSFTTVSGRSELSDPITFDVPFTSLLSLTWGQIHKPPVLSEDRLAVISSSGSGFQLGWINTVATGSATSTERGFYWTAIGVL